MSARSLIDHIHHGSLIKGEPETVRHLLLEFFERHWQIKTKANPDFSDQIFETMGIDEARTLKNRQSRQSFNGGRKIFLIQAEAITIEAQNSLLKIFEEPTENTHFFVFGACVSNLIPTLCSRLAEISLAELSATDLKKASAEKFIALTLAERLAFAKKLSAEIADEKKTKSDGLSLINALEKVLYEKAKQRGGVLPIKLFERLESCRDYFSDQSSSVKMILEYLALIVPRKQ